MDENGLPITGAGVNYAAVEAISQRELITYINLFLVRTCSFLNTFSTKCESKLSRLHARLDSIDTSITLLESKLNSVDDVKDLKLDDAGASSASAATGSVAQTAPVESAASAGTDGQLTAVVSSAASAVGVSDAAQVAPEQAAPVEQVPVKTVSQDERYVKYFRMLKLGVAEEAIRLKMRAEGADPDLLSQPNAPAPPADENAASSSEGSDDDSD